MPVRSCPNCDQATPRKLAASVGTSVNYYRCPRCGHVWHVPKDEPEAAPTTVMQGRWLAGE
jgi:hypothetical protein